MKNKHMNTGSSELLEFGTLNDSNYPIDDFAGYTGTSVMDIAGSSNNRKEKESDRDSRLNNYNNSDSEYNREQEKSQTLKSSGRDITESQSSFSRSDNKYLDNNTSSMTVGQLPIYDPSKYESQRLSISVDKKPTLEKDSSLDINNAIGLLDRNSVSRNSIKTVNTSYSNSSQSNSNISKTHSSNSPKRITETTPDGVRITKYSNGTVKKVYPNGQQEVTFLNGDTKISHTTGTVVYYYSNANTTHTTYIDGSEVYEFPNNQVSFTLYM
jgi:centromere protein J